ncbi:hypothetical protein DFP72DRAFT_265090 [Ephemerocybe angulata]|uniref:Secreted protein n=1 Tax=Ephemerocybe angulata TaxID=980116 RepID=A0A8H6I2W7_9AGAR|nr:hypothetical protein DFP72DRAFT_265090 [Tulosesus angulatus]
MGSFGSTCAVLGLLFGPRSWTGTLPCGVHRYLIRRPGLLPAMSATMACSWLHAPCARPPYPPPQNWTYHTTVSSYVHVRSTNITSTSHRLRLLLSSQ